MATTKPNPSPLSWAEQMARSGQKGHVHRQPENQADDPRPIKRWGLVEQSGIFVIVDGRDAPTSPGVWVEVPENFSRGNHLADGVELRADQTVAGARARRDELLVAADKLIWPYLDRGEAVPAAIADYKQALRDIPEQAGFPGAVVWPPKPTV